MPGDILCLWYDALYVNVDDIHKFVQSGPIHKGLFIILMAMYARTFDLAVEFKSNTKHIFFLNSWSNIWAMFVLNFTKYGASLHVWMPDDSPHNAWTFTTNTFDRKFQL